MCSTSSCSFYTPHHGLLNRPAPHDNYRKVALDLGLLHDEHEDQLCFNKVMERGYSPVQLRSLPVMLILDGDEHGRDILESNKDILMADLADKACIPNDIMWNSCLRDIANRLETMGRTMADFGLVCPNRQMTRLKKLENACGGTGAAVNSMWITTCLC